MSVNQCDVVIATKNRPEVLANCLRGLAQQSVKQFKVIVVDDFSDVPIAVNGADYPGLVVEVVRQPKPSGPAAARNAGAAKVTADFIVFIDDDVVADREFIATHLASARAGDASSPPVVTCGPFVQPGDWGEPTAWNLWEAKQAKKEADAMLRGDYAPTWRQFHTGNNCVPTAVFRRLNGFDERFKRAEDDEFGIRLAELGCQFVFVPSAIAWHYSYRSLAAWLSIPRAYAFYDVLIDKEHPEAGYLKQKKSELTRRKWPLRVARMLCQGSQPTAVGVQFSVAVAKVAYRLKATDLSMAALSVAYDLSYVQSLRETEANESTVGGA